MTKVPTFAELAARRIWDPKPGTIHYRDAINYAKDGMYAKDLISDYLQGLLILAKETKHALVWECGLFQWPFVKGMKIRKGIPHIGQPFTGPDGKILQYEGRILHGERDPDALSHLELSPLTFQQIHNHPNYRTWLATHLFANRSSNAITYHNRLGLNNKIACEQFINDPTSPKAIGPDSQAQGDGNRVYNEFGLLKVELKLKVGKRRRRKGEKKMKRKRRKCRSESEAGSESEGGEGSEEGNERSGASGGGVARAEFGGKSLSNRMDFSGSDGEGGEESDGGRGGRQDDLGKESSENDSSSEGEERIRKPRDTSWKGLRKTIGGKGPMQSSIALEAGQEKAEGEAEGESIESDN